MESASVLLSSSMIRLDACKLPYCSWNGWPWLWWRLDRPASWDGSRVPWWSDMTWEGAHFWESAEDGALGVESSTPGGTQIITFLGGSGGECFPPGIHGNFTGWQESGDRRRRDLCFLHTHSCGQLKTWMLRHSEGGNQIRAMLLSFDWQINNDQSGLADTQGSLMRLP